jgi:hypothetical protein
MTIVSREMENSKDWLNGEERKGQRKSEQDSYMSALLWRSWNGEVMDISLRNVIRHSL